MLNSRSRNVDHCAYHRPIVQGMYLRICDHVPSPHFEKDVLRKTNKPFQNGLYSFFQGEANPSVLAGSVGQVHSYLLAIRPLSIVGHMMAKVRHSIAAPCQQ